MLLLWHWATRSFRSQERSKTHIAQNQWVFRWFLAKVLLNFVNIWKSSAIPRRRSSNLVCSCSFSPFASPFPWQHSCHPFGSLSLFSNVRIFWNPYVLWATPSPKPPTPRTSMPGSLIATSFHQPACVWFCDVDGLWPWPREDREELLCMTLIVHRRQSFHSRPAMRLINNGVFSLLALFFGLLAMAAPTRGQEEEGERSIS